MLSIFILVHYYELLCALFFFTIFVLTLRLMRIKIKLKKKLNILAVSVFFKIKIITLDESPHTLHIESHTDDRDKPADSADKTFMR